MIFELSNEQRKYLGLNPVETKWDMVKFNDNIYLYFNGDKIVKKLILMKIIIMKVNSMKLQRKTERLCYPRPQKVKQKS